MRTESIPLAILAGGTTLPLALTPKLRGNVPYGDGRAFADLVTFPYELSVVDSNGASAQVQVSSADADTIVSEINTQAAGVCTASISERCLVLTGVSGQAWLRVEQVVSGLPDLAPFVGLPVHPHPSATSHVGDPLPPQANPASQANPTGAVFLANGEERSSSGVNRGLYALGRELERHQAALQAHAAYPTKTVIDVAAGIVDGTVLLDADGYIDQVSLESAGWLEVAGLSSASSTYAVAQRFTVSSAAGAWLPVWRDGAVTTARVAAVTRGARSSAIPRPVFHEDAAPDGALPDTSGASPDGNNALGVALLRSSGAVSDVRDGCILVCAGDDFVTDGVEAGDVALISGADVTAPHDQNGLWRVAAVLSATEILVRAVSADGPQILMRRGSGDYGTVTISTDGRFLDRLWVTLDPPLPIPASGEIAVHYAARGSVLASTDATPRGWSGLQDSPTATLRAAAESLDTVLTGQTAGFGGDAAPQRPVRLTQRQYAHAPTLASTGATRTGNLYGFVLETEDDHSVDASWIGTALLLGGRTGTYFVAAVYDGRHALLRPPAEDAHLGAISVSGCLYTELEDQEVDEPSSLITYILPQADGAGDPLSPLGVLMLRPQSDLGTDPTLPATTNLALEQIRLSGAGTNILTLAYTAVAGSSVLTPATAPEALGVILPSLSSETGGTALYVPGTICRILGGSDAGYYRIRVTAEGTPAIHLRGMDGSTVSLLETSGTFSLYRVAYATGWAWHGLPGGSLRHTGLHTHADFRQSGGTGYSATITWDGDGGGAFIGANDPNLAAYDRGNGATGYALTIQAYAPAYGLWARTAAGETGSEERRTSLGALLESYSNVLDMSEHSAPADLVSATATWGAGATLWAHGSGADPVLVVTRGADSGRPSAPGEPSGAALVVRDPPVTDTTRLWTGLDVAGMIYQRSGGPLVGDTAAVFEGGVGGGSWVRPTQRMRREPVAGGYTEEVTRLGDAGQVWPPLSAAVVATYTCTAPVYAINNLAHVGSVTINNTDLRDLVRSDRAAWIGRVIEITGSGGSEDGLYTIIGASTPFATAAVFALMSSTGTAWARTFNPTTVRVLGSRWYAGRVDVADWAQLGTAEASTQTEAPYLTTTPSLESTGVRAPTVPTGTSSSARAVSGRHGVAEILRHDAGSGVGIDHALVDMPGVGATDTAYTDGWAVDAEEPRAPFPNIGVVLGDTDPSYTDALGLHLSSSYPGNLVTQEYMLRHVSGPSAAILGYDRSHGGCLVVRNATSFGAPSAAVVQIIRRALWRPSTGMFRWRATAIVSRPVLSDTVGTLRFVLCRADGTEVYGEDVSVNTPADGAPAVYRHTFSDNALADGPTDALSDARETGLFFAIQVTLSTGTAASEEDVWRFHKITLVQGARAAEVSTDLRVFGTVLASDLRLREPVLSSVALHPLAMLPLTGSADFGKYANDASSSWNMRDTVDGRTTGYLLDAANELWFQPSLPSTTHVRSHQLSAVVGHQFMDPLYYLCVTGYDRALMVAPNRSGMVLPLTQLHHGDRLVRLHLSLSFRPTWIPQAGVAPGDAGHTFAEVGVYRSFPAGLDYITDGAKADWRERAAWAAVAGVQVVLRRHHLLDYGTPEDPPGDFYTGAPQAGYSEELLRYDVDLSGETLPDFDNDSYLGGEIHKNVAIDLGIEGVSAAALTVDTRHFAYSLSIEFYAGVRMVDSSDLTKYADEVYGDAEYAESRCTVNTVVTGTKSLDINGSYVAHPMPTWPMHKDQTYGTSPGNLPLSTSNIPYPPVVKFRGGVLKTSSDRLR